MKKQVSIKRKIVYICIVIALLSFCILVLSIVFAVGPEYIGGFSTFAADADGKLYLATTNDIIVVKDNEIVDRIDPLMEGYSLTIEDNVLITTSHSGGTCYMELDGTLIEKKDDAIEQLLDKKSYKHIFKDEFGNVYTLRNSYVLSWIIKESQDVKEICFITPLLSFIVRISLPISSTLLFISFMCLVLAFFFTFCRDMIKERYNNFLKL